MKELIVNKIAQALELFKKELFAIEENTLSLQKTLDDGLAKLTEKEACLKERAAEIEDKLLDGQDAIKEQKADLTKSQKDLQKEFDEYEELRHAVNAENKISAATRKDAEIDRSLAIEALAQAKDKRKTLARQMDDAKTAIAAADDIKKDLSERERQIVKQEIILNKREDKVIAKEDELVAREIKTRDSEKKVDREIKRLKLKVK